MHYTSLLLLNFSIYNVCQIRSIEINLCVLHLLLYAFPLIRIQWVFIRDSTGDNEEDQVAFIEIVISKLYWPVLSTASCTLFYLLNYNQASILPPVFVHLWGELSVITNPLKSWILSLFTNLCLTETDTPSLRSLQILYLFAFYIRLQRVQPRWFYHTDMRSQPRQQKWQ